MKRLIAVCLSLVSAASSSAQQKQLVAYLPYYKGPSAAQFAQTMDFTRITQLDVAFINPPKCAGKCTAQSSMVFGEEGHDPGEIDAIVAVAHEHHVKVLASLGGAGGDQNILQFYNAGLTKPLVASLDAYLRKHHLDGVDVDIEEPSLMGAPFADFVDELVRTLRPQHKLVTAAVAQYIQGAMPDATLAQFDQINLMVYSNMNDAQKALNFYSVTKKFPKEKITLGIPLFALSTEHKFEHYSAILAAYPNAWRVDQAGGGTLDDGQLFNYTGEVTTAKEARLGAQYGGVMVWEITEDAPAPHALMDIIRKNLP